METNHKRVNFYCLRCRHDWHLIAIWKWLNSAVGEVWQARCPQCRKKLIRLKDVDAGNDSYFRKSKFIKSQLRKHIDSLIQPGDPRFDRLYPQHKREREAKLEQKEREAYERAKRI